MQELLALTELLLPLLNLLPTSLLSLTALVLFIDDGCYGCSEARTTAKRATAKTVAITNSFDIWLPCKLYIMENVIFFFALVVFGWFVVKFIYSSSQALHGYKHGSRINRVRGVLPES